MLLFMILEPYSWELFLEKSFGFGLATPIYSKKLGGVQSVVKLVFFSNFFEELVYKLRSDIPVSLVYGSDFCIV